MKYAIAVLVLFFYSSVGSLADFGVYDLSRIGDGSFFSTAYSINDDLQIVGKCSTTAGDDGVELPFVWNSTTGIQLLSGGYGSGNVITNTGVIGGYLKNRTKNAVLWTAKDQAILDNLPGTGPQSAVLAISNVSGSLIAVGYSTVASAGQVRYQAVEWLWDQTNIQVGAAITATPNDGGGYTFDYTTSSKYDPVIVCRPISPSISGTGASADSGYTFSHIVETDHYGWSGFVGGKPITSQSSSGFLIADGSISNENTAFMGANQTGSVCGYTTGASSRAFIQKNGIRTLLPLPKGDDQSYAFALNNEHTQSCCFIDSSAAHSRQINVSALPDQISPQVVGYSTNSSGQSHAWIWSEPDGLELLPSIGGDNCWAYGVNGFGEICGSAEDSASNIRAVLWQHIPGSGKLLKSSRIDRGDLSPGPVSLTNWVVTSSNIAAGGIFFSFIQNPYAPTGIKVLGSFGMRKGDVVSIDGDLSITNNERVLLPHKILIEGAVSELPKPFGVIGRTLVESSQGNGAILSGLRVRAYGACSKKEYDPFVRLDDGTNFIEQAGYYEYDDKGNLILGPDGNPIWIPPVIGIRAYPLDPTFNFKPFEIFDGISSYLSPGVPVIWEAEPQD